MTSYSVDQLKYRVVANLMALIFAFPPAPLWANNESTDKAKGLVDEIERAYGDFEVGVRKEPHERRFKDYASVSVVVDDLCEKLAERGKENLATIKVAIMDSGLSSQTRRRLLVVLKNVPGTETEEVILSAGMNDSSLYDVAFNVLQARFHEKGGLEIVLSQEDLATFSEEIRNGAERRAAQAASYLSIFERTPIEARIGPVIERFEREIGEWLSEPEEQKLQKNEYYDFTMLLFLDVFTEFGPASRSFLGASATNNPRYKDAGKWYTLALAATGDKTVGDAVRRVIDDNREDVRVRTKAIRLYRKSLGIEAIPDLIRWSHDTTEVTNPMHGWKTFPIAAAARLELRIVEK